MESSWDDLVSRIVAGEVDDLEDTLSGSGIVADPQALDHARVMLDRFWDLIHQDPSRALGMAKLTAAVATARGAPALLRTEAARREATAAFALGRAYDAAALLESALELLASTGDDVPRPQVAAQRAALLGLLANAQLATGKTQPALIALEEAIAIARELELRPALGVYLSSLGNARITAGEARAAREYYQEALRIAREVGNREGESVNLNNVGLSDHALGSLSGAEDHYLEALALAKSMGDPRVAATAEANLGLVFADRGELERSHQHYQAALELARGLGDRGTQATVLIRLARIKREAGSYEVAQELTGQAGQLLADVEDPRRSALWSETGRCRLARGDLQGAAALFQQALAAARAVGDRRCEALAIFDLGRAAYRAGHLNEARDQLTEAVELARELEDRDMQAAAHGALAEALAGLGELRLAETSLEAAARQVEERPQTLLAGRHQLSKAALSQAHEDAPGAAALLEGVLRMARDRGFWALARDAEERLRALAPKAGESW
jgi:tetratricopeptide (TPR) repeat protein